VGSIGPISFSESVPHSVQLSLAEGSPAAITANGSSTTTFRARVLNSGGNPVIGNPVQVTSPAQGGLVLSANPATTDAAGVASFTLRSSTTAGDYIYSASAGGVNSASVGVQFSPGPLSAFVLSGVPGSPFTAGSVFGLTVTAKDAFGNTVTSHTGSVTWSSDDPQAVLPTSSSFGLGDAGVKTFASSFALKSVGTRAVTVSDSTGTITQSIPSVTVVSAAVSSQSSVLSSSPSAVVADGVASVGLTAQLKDAHGNPIVGQTVTLSSSRGAVDQIFPTSVVTDSLGNAAFAVRSTSAGSSTFTVSANGGAVGTIGPVEFETNTLDSLTLALQTPYLAQQTADGSSIFVLTVLARNSSGNPVNSTPINLSIPSQGGVRVGSDPIVSDSNGVASITLRTSTVAGSYGFSVSSDGVTSNTVSLQYRAGPLADWLVTGLPTGTLTAGVAWGFLLTAKDAHGNTVTDYSGTVSWSSSDSQAVLPESYSFLPQDAGVKSFAGGLVLRSAAQSTVTITDSVLSVSRQLGPITVIPGAVSSTASVLTSSSTSVATDTGESISLSVTIRDSFNNRISGKSVSLVSSRGASDQIAPASAQTNSSGLASFLISSSVVGSSTLNFLVDGESIGPITFFSSNQATLHLAVMPPYTSLVLADGSSTVGLFALYERMNGDRIVGSPVALTLPANGGAIVGSNTAVTDSTGIAYFTVQSSSIMGDYLITASSGSESATTTLSYYRPTLVYSTQPASSATFGSVLTPAPVIAVQDGMGRPLSTFNGMSVSLTLFRDNACSLSADAYGVQISSGSDQSVATTQASFSNFSIQGAVSGTYYIKAILGSLPSVCSNAVALSVGSGTTTPVPQISSNPLFWLRADALGGGLTNGANVASWTDSTSNSRNASQSSAGNQPTFRTNVLNGRPVIRFGGNQYLSIPSSSIAKQGSYTIFSVLALGSYPQSAYVYGSLSSTGANASSWGTASTSTNGTFNGMFGNGTAFSMSATSSTDPIFSSANQFVILTQTYSAGDNRDGFRKNGVPVTTTLSSGTATASSGTAFSFSLGRSGDWNSRCKLEEPSKLW